MFRNPLSLFFSPFLAVVFTACSDAPPPARSFYYWKTVFALDATEREALTVGAVDRLYIRYFDVIPGNNGQAPLPDATIVFKDSLPANMNAVPVVFIVNKVLEELPADSIATLARLICTRIESINRAHRITRVPEIQLDCDWNASTRDKYFRLLHAFRNCSYSTGKKLSATLRLHQLKYRKSTGIPPVDRVTLMCYNMGRLTEYDVRNSILDADEARSYLRFSGIYPLPADVAFPLFGWGVCFSSGKYRGLINNLTAADLQQPYFSEIAPNMYRADSSVMLRGAYIRKGDQIRLEEPSGEEIKQVAREVASRMKSPDYVVWYHLDSLLLQKHPDHELQEVIDMFR